MAENSKQEDLPILIIGGGCNGLVLAQALHVVVHALSPSTTNDYYGRDWGIALHWATALLESMVGKEKWSRVDETMVDPYIKPAKLEYFPILNGKTGELLTEKPAENLCRVLRSRLRKFAAEGLPDLRLNKKLERFSYADDGKSVTAYFSDGTSETGRLLVGADGSQSKVRRELVGLERAAVKRLPLVATFITASFSAEYAVALRKIAGNALISLWPHPDNMLGALTLMDGIEKDHPEKWRFTFYVAWPSSLEEQAAEVAAGVSIRDRLRKAKEKSKAFVNPIRKCFELLPDDHEEVYWVGLSNWDPTLPEHKWDNHGGLVTLVGDAAHPMTYHRGQGLSHGLADVYNLVNLLANPEGRSQAELIDAYESEMRPRAGEEVQLSEMNSIMLHDGSRATESPMVKIGLSYGSSKAEKPYSAVEVKMG
ncbi:FAD/NAD(P)-binding domain-containing protein [Daldinia vernicosa]|uniref:FAD/NAD(P)-binding domain-containing protein n=1 Tax=Daldinia vernicosa TaxID=114800 RepID=UPI002008622E|nr:FAD/NAD(P)-binding domain-containing protein [Daldinia vernicosa]KAI0852376.1 FAD/NAD(P)-binding domain-containing protein [Daldinia vernicosa]